MDEKYIRDRITYLRMKKGVSEYQMSLDLGHSKSYIQSISHGRALPSMSEFLYMCEYFGITPKEFFADDETATPLLVKEIMESIKGFSDDDLDLVLSVIKRFNKRNERK